jgi:8-oxo-dGTP pyrophosphatase MutT (NUDIX family)
MDSRWKPSTTVAAVIERDGLFLLVEEHTPEGLRLNNPAGHLDPGESPANGCARETLEETAYQFTPTALVGIYLSRFSRPENHTLGTAAEDITFLRFAYCGTLSSFDTERKLDTGIVRTVWLTPEQVRASAALHRSPLVVRCMEDYLRGCRYPMELVTTDLSVFRVDSPLG